jgi:hypothetical protein
LLLVEDHTADATMTGVMIVEALVETEVVECPIVEMEAGAVEMMETLTNDMNAGDDRDEATAY